LVIAYGLNRDQDLGTVALIPKLHYASVAEMALQSPFPRLTLFLIFPLTFP